MMDTNSSSSTKLIGTGGKTATTRKRSRTAVEPDQVGEGSQTSKASLVKKKHKALTLPNWIDIPEWKTDRSFLMEMPVEILDKIFGPESELSLQDHLALSGTCRRFNKAYTADIWECLLYGVNRVISSHIFSTAWTKGDNDDTTTDTRTTSGPKPTLTAKAQVISNVNTYSLALTNARLKFKVTEREIMTLPFTPTRNPRYRNAAPMKMFLQSRVYSLAMRVHRGPLGHRAHLKKLAERDAKSKETRKANGTLPVKKASASDCMPHATYDDDGLPEDNGSDGNNGYGEENYVWDDY